MEYVRRGNTRKVQWMLEHEEVDPNAYDNGETALGIAIRTKKMLMAVCLLSHPTVDPNKVSKLVWEYRDTTVSPLLIAIALHNTNMVRALLAHPRVDMNLPWYSRFCAITPAMAAIFYETPSEIRRLLLTDARLDIQAVDEYGNQIWHYCCVSWYAFYRFYLRKNWLSRGLTRLPSNILDMILLHAAIMEISTSQPDVQYYSKNTLRDIANYMGVPPELSERWRVQYDVATMKMVVGDVVSIGATWHEGRFREQTQKRKATLRALSLQLERTLDAMRTMGIQTEDLRIAYEKL